MEDTFAEPLPTEDPVLHEQPETEKVSNRMLEAARWTGKWTLRTIPIAACGITAGLGLTHGWPTTLEAEPLSIDASLHLGSDTRIETNGSPLVCDTDDYSPLALTVFPKAGSGTEALLRNDSNPLATMKEKITNEAEGQWVPLFSILSVKFMAGAVVGGAGGAAIVELALGDRKNYAERLRKDVRLAAALASIMPLLSVPALASFDSTPACRAEGALAEAMAFPGIMDNITQANAAYTEKFQNFLSNRDGSARYLTESQESSEQKPALRLLHISDLHGEDVFSLIHMLIKNGDIDAVLNTGDEVNFGLEEELTPQLIEGIRSLGIPYIIVKGNHDSNPVMEKLSQIDNVVVLDEQIIDLQGLRISGEPDPRSYGDGSPEDNQKQAQLQINHAQSVTARWSAEKKPNVDLFLAHDPSTAETYASITNLILNGHMHRPEYRELDANTVQIIAGTISGGGLLNGRDKNDEGHPEQQRQSWGIISYSAHCQPTTYERFSIPDVTTATDTFDYTSELIELPKSPTEPERTCGTNAYSVIKEPNEALREQYAAPQN